MRYLLDTCTFLWTAQEPALLSQAATSVLNDERNEFYLSDVSVLEVTLKHSAGKLPLPANPRSWIPEKLNHHQLQRVSLSHEAIFMSGELPRTHMDPFDRLLAAQALENGFIILSPDTQLSVLGAQRIW